MVRHSHLGGLLAFSHASVPVGSSVREQYVNTTTVRLPACQSSRDNAWDMHPVSKPVGRTARSQLKPRQVLHTFELGDEVVLVCIHIFVRGRALLSHRHRCGLQRAAAHALLRFMWAASA